MAVVLLAAKYTAVFNTGFPAQSCTLSGAKVSVLTGATASTSGRRRTRSKHSSTRGGSRLSEVEARHDHGIAIHRPERRQAAARVDVTAGSRTVGSHDVVVDPVARDDAGRVRGRSRRQDLLERADAV